MTDVQQIETAVCGHQLFPSRAQFLATIGKLLKIHNFWAHLFPVKTFWLITALCGNICGWPLIDLRDLVKNDGKRKKAQHTNIEGA